jgi:hypothetical protein
MINVGMRRIDPVQAVDDDSLSMSIFTTTIFNAAALVLV